MRATNFKQGDWVVFRKQKTSNSPGPRAKLTTPSPKGESYAYVVEKFWIVANVTDNELQLVTRRGKQHQVPKSDPRIRKATLWDRLFRSHRFREVEKCLDGVELT